MFDRATIAQALQGRDAVVRVVICSYQGSSPREAGAAMLVFAEGQTGTIGGGALEYDASLKARAMLTGGDLPRVERVALGPNLGQCCGGAVTLAYERFDANSLAMLPEDGLYARPVAADAPEEMPLPIRRAMKTARGQGVMAPRYLQGWLAEPVAPPQRQLWVWGAGHVGRAIVHTINPLPNVAITWLDTARNRFPEVIPEGVTARIADNPADLVPEAPAQAEHLILTYSHALDLDLCHRLLTHGFGFCGLIGSASKWARFRSRLTALGHPPEKVGEITCPIGDPSFGKHPNAIAISVAAAFLSRAEPVQKRERA
ncbi:xanthine dehydrogenase accessory protein XdhC [Pararhodobacter oceanensis]|uniref:Xanthine dehydrogenase accessory protein XdhC n=1 Tax=Pararhodobacter oceanensis TaxID=2172121 RepID=A0A2T8HXF4_9RHOB|nr:xanthine dehydrogenase accessory protein XdhC [Pararhodobacter oceanensis]PVH30042.1 xanthine dehydrogenase accessory protein XdhC [Pararhodobacter oceanensis]